MQKLFIAVACFLFVSCTASKKAVLKNIRSIRFIDEYILPHKMQFGSTTVGGLSGIDYNQQDGDYYLICDDRSDINPVRFYTAKIVLTKTGIDTVYFTGVTNFLQRNGKVYYNRSQNAFGVPDPEAIRYDPSTKTIAWSSEGERTVRKDATVLTDPSITVVNQNGQWIDSLRLPANMRMSKTPAGPRNNGVFEGLAFSSDYQSLFVSVEEPLYDDGPRAGLFDSTGWTRIVRFNTKTRLPQAQYAYQIDPIVQEPISTGLFAVNGVTDILAVNEHQLLVTERSFSTGRLGNNIRVYLVELNGADDVSSVKSLHSSLPQKPLQKKLLLNMDSLGRLIDNIEGATFGPRLPNGKRSLLFISDDNFSKEQKTQLLLFEVE